MNATKILPLALLASIPMLAGAGGGCSEREGTSDYKQQQAQERILAEGTAQTGMPAIKNFRERKLLKDILELRDQEGLTTYTYLVAEMDARPRFLCTSVGYGIPYATQYTNPEKLVYNGGSYSYNNLPQADPNGLFSPSSAEGTWVLCLDSASKSVEVVYVEPRIIVSPIRLTEIEKTPVEKP